MPLIYRQLIVFAMIALLNGCASVPRITPEQRAQLEQPARQFMSQGAWQEAAVAWLQAAKQVSGVLSTHYRLNAAKALLAAGDGDGARKIVQGLAASQPPATAARRRLILAEADLLSGNAALALQRLGPAVESRERNLQADYHRLRSEALRVSGQDMAAVRERSLLDSYLDPGPDRYRNRQKIWDALTAASDAQLQSVEIQPLQIFSGWVALAKVVRASSQDMDTLKTAIEAWNMRFPAHPAGDQIVPQIFEQARAEAQPPAKVALLLPLSGPFKAAAIAIRDGLMAAWFADAPNPHRPELILRDSSSGDISNTYSEALGNGAQFIIGPLAKHRVAQLLRSGDIQVPTLALNYPDSPTADATPANTELPATHRRQVYLFALAPEDEAEHAAEHAFTDERMNAAILAPRGPWGERVAGAFGSTWIKQGGQVVAQKFYPEQAKDVSATVKQFLNYDQSEQRARRLRRVLGRKLKHEAEPRHDIDIIFLAAFPRAARQIKPLLQFYRAGNVPVIATSHIYTGVEDPRADQDLNGIEFEDMPWTLRPNDYGLPAQIEALWPAAHGSLGRLYAFGADAYTLVSRLAALRKSGAPPIPGLTGALWMDKRGRIQRALQWARMKQGIPVLEPPAVP